MPALLTAAEMALTADWMEASSCVRSPCAVGYLRCSDRKNLVMVMQLVSMGCSAMLSASRSWLKKYGMISRIITFSYER